MDATAPKRLGASRSEPRRLDVLPLLFAAIVAPIAGMLTTMLLAPHHTTWSAFAFVTVAPASALLFARCRRAGWGMAAACAAAAWIITALCFALLLGYMLWELGEDWSPRTE